MKMPSATSTPRMPSALPKVEANKIQADMIVSMSDLEEHGKEVSAMIRGDQIIPGNITGDLNDAATLIEHILTHQEVVATSMNISHLPDGRFRATVLRKHGDWYRVVGASIREVMEGLRNAVNG